MSEPREPLVWLPFEPALLGDPPRWGRFSVSREGNPRAVTVTIEAPADREFAESIARALEDSR